MNIPNFLTIVRIFFVPLLVAALVQQDVTIGFRGMVFTNDLLALAIFLVAAVTDLLDGYLARRWGQVTTIGTLLDPIADKLLVSAALISLVQIANLPSPACAASPRRKATPSPPATSPRPRPSPR
jgi:CDP-diacylglycerol--glycerol-3-phosphate 3-phosphatidyltransferase